MERWKQPFADKSELCGQARRKSASYHRGMSPVVETRFNTNREQEIVVLLSANLVSGVDRSGRLRMNASCSESVWDSIANGSNRVSFEMSGMPEECGKRFWIEIKFHAVGTRGRYLFRESATESLPCSCSRRISTAIIAWSPTQARIQLLDCRSGLSCALLDLESKSIQANVHITKVRFDEVNGELPVDRTPNNAPAIMGFLADDIAKSACVGLAISQTVDAVEILIGARVALFNTRRAERFEKFCCPIADVISL